MHTHAVKACRDSVSCGCRQPRALREKRPSVCCLIVNAGLFTNTLRLSAEPHGMPPRLLPRVTGVAALVWVMGAHASGEGAGSPETRPQSPEINASVQAIYRTGRSRFGNTRSELTD
jgi:hypothetical protein